MGRVRAALKAVMDSESPDFRGDLSALDDLKAMDLAKGKLTKIWSWRRRGGGERAARAEACAVWCVT